MKIIKLVLVGLSTYILFTICQSLAVAERGTSAVGGEILVLLLPIILYAFIENIKLTKQAKKETAQPIKNGCIEIKSIESIEVIEE